MRNPAVLVLAVAAIALVLVSGAGADDVTHDAEVTVAPGGAANVSITITGVGNDGEPGCNADATTPATVAVTASDPISASPSTLEFQGCGSQNVSLSASASAADGDYTVNVSVTDAGAGTYSVSPGSIAVHVVTPPPPPPPADTTPPVITLPAGTPITAEATSSAGAVVTYGSASAVDAVDGPVAVSCAPPSGATFAIGSTTVGCSATDAANNPATATFTVTVQDKTAPTFTLPAPINVLATSTAGAVVTYSAFANDAVDSTPSLTCEPTSGSMFAIGATTVTCTAEDDSGNEGSASFSVTVADAAPVVSVPPTQTVEATGPNGAKVTFVPAPSASDTIEGPLTPSCTPASGATFPLGTTTVTCTVADSSGSTVSASFQVAVVDTTPPVLSIPPNWTFVGGNDGLPRSNPSLAVYLGRARTTDLVDPAPLLVVEAPDVLPLGPTAVRYVAIDNAGNVTSDSTIITVVPPPAPGQPRPPAPPADDPPPGNVTGLRARAGNRLIRLSWNAPRDRDIARYAAFRSERSGPQVQVFSGTGTSFTDRGLVNGTEYRYVVVAYDRAGHRSVGVAVLATPRLPMLLAPQEGARLARATTFSWRRVTGARYYNFQLFRATGTFAAGSQQRFQKVLSVWPVTNRFRLGLTWRFAGRTYRLVPGTYRWYVWPGFGTRADARYGDVLGDRSFVVVRRR